MAATDRTTTMEPNAPKFGVCRCAPADEEWRQINRETRDHGTEVTYECQTCGCNDTAFFERVMA